MEDECSKLSTQVQEAEMPEIPELPPSLIPGSLILSHIPTVLHQPSSKSTISYSHGLDTRHESLKELHNIHQYFVNLEEAQKNTKLIELLDELEFNQIVIFVSNAERAIEVNQLLEDANFPTMYMHSQLSQEECNRRFMSFKNQENRILITTEWFGRSSEIRQDIVINYDFPRGGSQQYLYR